MAASTSPACIKQLNVMLTVAHVLVCSDTIDYNVTLSAYVTLMPCKVIICPADVEQLLPHVLPHVNFATC